MVTVFLHREKGIQVLYSEKKERKKMKFAKNDEYFISYISEPPTLQHIALVSLAIKLWSEPDLNKDMRHYTERFGFDTETNSAMEAYVKFKERVFKKLSDCFLPNSLKFKVSNIIPPIGLQLLKGFSKPVVDNCNPRFRDLIRDKEYCRFYDIFKLGGSVHWTMEGIIDNVTSLKELINNEHQGKEFNCLYDLACKYCLEEYIPGIWRKISSDKKNDIIRGHKNYDCHIVAYWTAYVENKLSDCLRKISENDVRNIYDNNLSIQLNMISLSIFISNPYSLRHFWYKLDQQEKEANVKNWVIQALNKYKSGGRHEYQNYKDKTTILCFLLSELGDKNQQKEVFRTYSKIILKALFYDWPWQRFFLPTITMMLDYIPEHSFDKIMSHITKEIKVGRTTADVFREIWLKSSLKLKKSFVKFLMYTRRTCTYRIDNTSTLYRFIAVDNIETIFMILKYANKKEKKGILLKMINNYELYHVINSNKLSVIETLFTKYLSSNCDISKFKNFVMIKYADDLIQDWIKDNNFQAAETLLNWGFHHPRKLNNFKKKFIQKNEIYAYLVHLGDYELVNRFMNWYFENEDEICKFKNTFIFEVDKEGFYTCLTLLRDLSNNEQGWDLFQKFINYSCDSPEEVLQFKSKFLDSVIYFLRYYNFEFSTKFLSWCLDSDDKVNQFKNLLVLSDKAIELIVFAVNMNYPAWSQVSELIKWFSVSKITAAELKHKLDKIDLFFNFRKDTEADYKRRGLLYLVDKHVVDDNIKSKGISESENTVSDIDANMMEMLSRNNNEL